MKVIVFGATGFIGHEIALALARAGHTVIGTTRSAESAKKLESEEIIPKVCDPADPSQYREDLAGVDVVIDAVGGGNIASIGHIILDSAIEVAKKTRPFGPPLSYIYCSGTWVHGDHKTEIVSDRTPITRPNKLTEWRLEIEHKAVKSISSSFTANVIRPSLLYGGSGSLTAMLFSGAKAGEIVWFGDEDSRMALIHKEDLGEAFRLCAEKSYAVPGVIFDVSNPYPESTKAVFGRLKEVSGAEKVTYKKPENNFQVALGSTAVLRPQLAKSLLGWEARKAPLADGMEVYYRAWLASA
jgi:nucleoside-diphosphate-sugar epimerase